MSNFFKNNITTFIIRSVVSNRGSVIDVTEEFRWRHTMNENNSKYNSNIIMQQREQSFEAHEGRTNV